MPKEELLVLFGEEERWTMTKEELLVLSDDSCCWRRDRVASMVSSERNV